MEFRKIALTELDFNTGQIPGLPPNPREWTDLELKRLAKSMKGTPELVEARGCIVVPYEGRYVVLGGNLRLAAAKYLKWTDIMCAVLPEGTKVSKLKEIVLKDNSSFGSWDLSLLRKDWSEFDFGDWGINVTWDTAGPAPDASVSETPQEVVEDDFDETTPDIAKRCKRGDIWQLGDHRLMCGDSTDQTQMSLLMNGEKADISFTSPPYNAGHLDIPGNERTKKKYQNDDDQRTELEYTEFLRKNVELLLDVSAEVFYNLGVVAGSKISIINILYFFRKFFKDFIYWKKSNPVNAIAHGVISSSVELILCFGKNNSRRFNDTHFDNGEYYLGVIEGSVASNNEYSQIHKATFPMYLPENIIKNFTSPGSLVLDCFGGTGTTLIAAEQLNRKCYMMELDPNYCDVIIARWEKFTGRKATKIE